MFKKTLNTFLTDLLQCAGHLVCVLRAHQPSHLLPIAQKHQRGPQLHAVAAAESLTGAVLYFEVGDCAIPLQRLLDVWLRSESEATPRRAEFEQGGAG